MRKELSCTLPLCRIEMPSAVLSLQKGGMLQPQVRRQIQPFSPFLEIFLTLFHPGVAKIHESFLDLFRLLRRREIRRRQDGFNFRPVCDFFPCAFLLRAISSKRVRSSRRVFSPTLSEDKRERAVLRSSAPRADNLRMFERETFSLNTNSLTSSSMRQETSRCSKSSRSSPGKIWAEKS